MNVLALFKDKWQCMSNFSSDASYEYSTLSSDPDSPSAFRQLLEFFIENEGPMAM